MRGDGPQARQVNAGSVVYAIGEDRTSPWLEAIAGIRGDHVPGWAPRLCRLSLHDRRVHPGRQPMTAAPPLPGGGVAQATPQSDPRRPRRHLVAAPTPAPCHPAPWWARAVPLELQALQPRWAPWLWRRPSANSVGQRAALFGRGSSLSPTRATRSRLRRIEKNPGHVWYHNSGSGGL